MPVEPTSTAGRSSPPPPCPAVTDLTCYDEWALRFRSVFRIANEQDRPIPEIVNSLGQTDGWLRHFFFTDLEQMRVRHTILLESAAECTIDQWKGEFDLKTVTETRQILQDIRRMWGVEKPAQTEVSSATEDLPRVAGQQRPEVLRAAASRFMSTAEELEARMLLAAAESAARASE